MYSHSYLEKDKVFLYVFEYLALLLTPSLVRRQQYEKRQQRREGKKEGKAKTRERVRVKVAVRRRERVWRKRLRKEKRVVTFYTVR